MSLANVGRARRVRNSGSDTLRALNLIVSNNASINTINTSAIRAGNVALGGTPLSMTLNGKEDTLTFASGTPSATGSVSRSGNTVTITPPDLSGKQDTLSFVTAAANGTGALTTNGNTVTYTPPDLSNKQDNLTFVSGTPNGDGSITRTGTTVTVIPPLVPRFKFLAYYNTAQIVCLNATQWGNPNNVSLNNWTVQLNNAVGSGYVHSTTSYTVPRTGYYFFSCSIMFIDPNDFLVYAAVRLFKNNLYVRDGLSQLRSLNAGLLNSVAGDDDTARYMPIHLNFLMQLNQGDVLDMRTFGYTASTSNVSVQTQGQNTVWSIIEV